MNAKKLMAAALLSTVIVSTSAAAADLVIANARLIDGTGADPLDGVSIVIEHDRIVDVTAGPVDASGATVIDADGATVMPGLSELHVHSSLQFLIPPEELANSQGYPDPKWAITSDEKMQEFIDTAFPGRMMKFLESGVTTIVDPGSYYPWIIQMRDKVRSGEVTGPNMYVTGRLFTAPGGHPAATVCNNHPWCVRTITVSTDDPEEAREAVRMMVAGGVDGLKMVYDGSESRGFIGADNPLGFVLHHLKKDVMEAVIDEGHKQGVKVLAHVHALQDNEDVILAGIDGMVHASPMDRKNGYQTPGGYDLPTLMNRHDVSMTTTVRSGVDEERLAQMPPAMQEQARAQLAHLGASLRAMQDAGVVLNFGTDFEGVGLDPQPRELIVDEAKTLMMAGFSAMEVIQMTTGNAAGHPLTPDDMGVIKAGNVADVIILRDDPLEDIEAMTWPQVVVLAGEIVVDKR